MDKLDRLISNFSNFNSDKVVTSVLKRNEKDIVRFNVHQMYDLGVNSLGKQIGEYTSRTKQIKSMKGQKINFVTLRDTKEFHKSIYVIFGESEFEIVSDDPITDILFERYSEEILGLTGESLDLLLDLLQNDIFIESKRQLLR